MEQCMAECKNRSISLVDNLMLLRIRIESCTNPIILDEDDYGIELSHH